MKRRRTRLGKALQLGLLLALSLVIVLSIIVFSIGPSFVAKRLNLVGNATFAPLKPSIQVLHQSLTIADLHADSLLWGRNLARLSDYGHVDIPRLIQGNVALQTFTVVTKVPTSLMLEGNSDRSDDIIKLALLQRWPMTTWFSLKARALYQAKQFQKLENKAPDQFRIIKTQTDWNEYLQQRANNQQITAGLLGLEGAHALEGNVENVDRLYDAGFRLIGLAHFFDTPVSGSAHGIDRGGLTALGRQVIQRMADLSMIIDLAHASSQTIDDVLQITNRPVIVSHTGVQGTCDNARNLSDRQLQQIAQTGGVIGIGFWQTAVCGEDVSAIVRAIRYVADLVGVEHVALGSDFDGAVRVPFDATHLEQVTNALKEDGFTETEIAKIMGLNVIQLVEKLLPV
ncbi:MAG: dipeptidase [Cyanobacteria bacterium J06635_15]